MREPVAAVPIEGDRASVPDPRRHARYPRPVAEGNDRRAGHRLEEAAADVGLEGLGLAGEPGRLAGVDVGQHLRDALQAQGVVPVQHEGPEGVVRVGGLSLEHAVAVAPELLAEVPGPPVQDEARRLQELRLDRPDPRVVPGVAVVLPEAPEDGARLQHVAAEVLHEAVVVLLVEEVRQAAPSLLVPAHGVHDLDDRGGLGPDGGVEADGRGEGAVRLPPVGDEVQVQQARADHLLDPRLGQLHSGRLRRASPRQKRRHSAWRSSKRFAASRTARSRERGRWGRSSS